MNNKEIFEMLGNDISKIKLPPISDKVYQAMREKREKVQESSEKNKDKTHKGFYLAAAITALVLSVPIVVVGSSHNSVSEPSSYNSDNNSSSSSSSIVSKTEISKDRGSTLEMITERKIFGEVALTGRTENECEILLNNYQSGSKVYEDDNYLYNFDSDGKLNEILNTKELTEEGSPADREKISAKTEELFSLYFPQLKREEFDIEISENKDCMPAWSVEYKMTADGIVYNRIMMNFNKYGNLYYAAIFGSDGDIGKISRSQAIDIALNEIKSGKYDVPEFGKYDVEISIGTEKSKGIYNVVIERIPTGKMDLLKSAFVNIDYNSGEIVFLEIS